MKHIEWAQEVAAQARNAAPIPIAFIGDNLGFFTMDNTIKLLGLGYLILQIGYLGWKWRKEARGGIKQDK